jgi:hypothetical protein
MASPYRPELREKKMWMEGRGTTVRVVGNATV